MDHTTLTAGQYTPVIARLMAQRGLPRKRLARVRLTGQGASRQPGAGHPGTLAET